MYDMYIVVDRLSSKMFVDLFNNFFYYKNNNPKIYVIFSKNLYF